MYAELVRVFSTMQVLKQKMLNYHWNVTGPDFYQTHLLLERLYGIVDGYTDRFAEHIRGYGRAPGLYSVYLSYSAVKEGDGSIPNAGTILSELAADTVLLAQQIKIANDAAGKADRPDTLNLLGDFAEQVATISYLLNSNKPGFNV